MEKKYKMFIGGLISAILMSLVLFLNHILPDFRLIWFIFFVISGLLCYLYLDMH